MKKLSNRLSLIYWIPDMGPGRKNPRAFDLHGVGGGLGKNTYRGRDAYRWALQRGTTIFKNIYILSHSSHLINIRK